MRQQQEDILMLPRTEDSSSADYISDVWHLIKSAAQAAFQQHDNKTSSFVLRIKHCCHKCENVKMSFSNTESETQFFVAWLLVYFILMTESFKQLTSAFNDLLIM